jgi:hypothetical protein
MIIIEDLRTRRDAKISPECPSGRNQDRQLMTSIAQSQRRKADHRGLSHSSEIGPMTQKLSEAI